MSDAPRFLSVGNAAVLVGKSTKTIRTWHRDGLLPNTRRTPSGHRLILLADLRALVNKGGEKNGR